MTLPIDLVNAGRIVLTDVVRAVVNVRLTGGASVARHTVTHVGSGGQVFTGGCILTGAGETLVHVYLTVDALVP